MVQHLLSDPSHDFTVDGRSAMYAKASVLLGEAMAVATSYATGTPFLPYPIFPVY